MAAAKRVRTFKEARLGLSKGEALEDAKIFLERERSVKGEGCPLGTDFFAVMRAVAKNDLAAAYEKLLEADPFPAVTGRIAPDPYPETQVFNRKSQKISLRAIACFVADQVRVKKASAQPRSRQKVAVVGSGPAGLAAASGLARLGFRVTVFESSHVLGGTLSYCYPLFRLPEKALSTSLSRLQAQGIEFVSNILIGRDAGIQELFDQGFAAVLLACGAGVPKGLGIPGEDAAGVLSVESFLKLRHWMKAGIEPYSTPLDVGRKVLIVGGGERAFDAARILVRLGRTVTVVVSGSDSALGVEAAMAREAAEEGVKVRTFARALRVQKDHVGCVKVLECEHLDYKIDGQGQLTTVVQPDSDFTMEADTILTVAGGRPDTLFLHRVPGLEFASDGAPVLKSGTRHETSLGGVFACGQLTEPDAGFLAAVNSGKRAVGEITKFLEV